MGLREESPDNTTDCLEEAAESQALMQSGLNHLYCWQDARSEVEFIKSVDVHFVPLEVKSG